MDLLKFFRKKTEPVKPVQLSEEDKAQRHIEAVRSVVHSLIAEGKPLLPMSGGRSSVEGNTLGLPAQFGAVESDFPFQLLPVLENLAMYNRHVSYAVENIVTLAGTDVEIYFSDSVKDDQGKKMRQHLKNRERTWYAYTDGKATMRNDLFAQIATFGPLSAEIVPLKNLKGVQKIVRVTPASIRFAYDEQLDEYIPLQKSPATTTGKYPGYVELNQQKYVYAAIRKYKNIPYAVPPLISALEDLITENEMLAGFKEIIKKLGLLGFLSVMVTAPDIDYQNNESPEQYQTRLKNHLTNNIQPQVENGFKKGLAIGYKNTHEFKLEGNNMNTNGAEQLLKMIKSLVFAGIKQDPNMLGENYSTTETFGRVILAKMATQIENYQNIVAAFLEKLYFTELTLAGFNPGYVEVKFKKSLIGDQKREQETEEVQIRNVTAKRDKGYITQDMAAQELGYDKAALPGNFQPDPLPEPGDGPPVPGAKPAAAKKGKESKGPSNPTPDKAAVSNKATFDAHMVRLLASLRADAPVYAYAVPEACTRPENASFGLSFGDFGDSRLERYIARYTKRLNKLFGAAVASAAESFKQDIESMPENTSAEALADAAIFHLLKDWRANFVEPVKEITADIIPAAYTVYRKDKSVFTGAKSFKKSLKFADASDLPDAVFNLPDYRTMDYLQELDNLYLGKFITDDDTRSRIKGYITDEYIAENSPIGKKSKQLDSFISNFQDVVNLERWKMRRIVETTLNKARNYANVNYIAQAEMEQFEIVEVNDRLTCDHCSTMHGKVFEVAAAVEQIKNVVNGKPEEVGKLSPFATTIPIDELRGLSASEIQGRGISTPSYHPHCRGRVVAAF